MISQVFARTQFLRAFYQDDKARARLASKWLTFHQEHALLYAPVLLGIGIALYFSLGFEPDFRVVFNLWIGSLAFLLLSHQIYILSPNLNALRVVSFLLCLLISGVFLAQYRTIEVHAPMLKKEIKFADLTGVVSSVDILAQGQGQRLTLQNLRIEDIAPADTPYSVRLKIRGEEVYRPGDRVSALASLTPPSPPIAPGAFDFQRYSYFKRLGAVGFTYHAPEIIERSEGNRNFSAFWEGLRLTVTHKIQEAIPLSLQGVMITFMTGEKSSIAEDDLQAMRDSGLAHLLAISGLHVGLVAGFVFFFVRLGLAALPDMALKYPIKKWAAGVALVFAFFYMFLVGASVPTQRAMMMTGIALFAIMIDRSPFSLRMVALAALVILISYPEALVSASFQMSFAAVTALVAFYDFFRPQIQNLYREAGVIRKAFLYFVGILTTTLIAGSATALYGMYHFQAWSLYSTLANLLAMPVVGMLVMPAAVLSYIGMPFGLADYPLLLMGFGIDWVLQIAHYVAGLEGAVITVAAFPQVYLGGLTLSLLCILIGPTLLRYIGAVFFFLCICGLLLTTSSSRLFISERGDLVGLYDQDQQTLYVSTLQKERYVRENWARMLGVNDREDVLPFKQHQNAKCDAAGCRLDLKSYKIAFSNDEYELQSECLWADILISARALPKSCSSQTIIDYRIMKSEGSIRVKLLSKQALVTSVREVRGLRPWTH